MIVRGMASISRVDVEMSGNMVRRFESSIFDVDVMSIGGVYRRGVEPSAEGKATWFLLYLAQSHNLCSVVAMTPFRYMG